MFPTTCPVCSEPLVRAEGESDTFCTNSSARSSAGSASSTSRAAARWTSRASASAPCPLFLEHGLVHDAADIYTLDWDDVPRLEGFGEISVTNLLRAIEASKHRPLPTCSSASASSTSGGRRPTSLAHGVRPPRRSMAATEADLAAVEGVGRDHRPRRCTRGSTNDGNREWSRSCERQASTSTGPRRPRCRRCSPGKSSSSPARSTASREEAEEAIKARGGKSPGQRVEEDDRGRRRRGAGRGEAHEGRGARRPDPRRGTASGALLETRRAPGA